MKQIIIALMIVTLLFLVGCSIRGTYYFLIPVPEFNITQDYVNGSLITYVNNVPSYITDYWIMNATDDDEERWEEIEDWSKFKPIEQEYFEINILYPGLNYNKQQIDQGEVARFRKIISRIPSEYFKDIEYISLTNKQHPNKIYQAYTHCENNKCHIRQYELMYLTDNDIYNLILHELGHKFEYKELSKHHGDNEIFEDGDLSEDYAEEWRIDHGGDPLQSYSSIQNWRNK